MTDMTEEELNAFSMIGDVEERLVELNHQIDRM